MREEQKRTISVYMYEHKKTGRRYCGITSQSLDGRLRSGYKLNKDFNKALITEGVDGFRRNIIREFDNEEDARRLERILMCWTYRIQSMVLTSLREESKFLD